MTSSNSMKKTKGRKKGSKKGVSEQGGMLGLPNVDGKFKGMTEVKGKQKMGPKGKAKPKAVHAGKVAAPYKGGKKPKGK